MSALLRLAPFVLQRRGFLVALVTLALLVSGLWALALTVSYPIVKVLLQGQNLHEYVHAEIASAEGVLTEQGDRLRWLDELIAGRPTPIAGTADDDYSKLIRDRARCQEELAIASRRVLTFRSLQNHLLPWLPRDSFESLATLLLVLGALLAARAAVVFAQECLLGQFVERTLMLVRSRLYSHVLRLDHQAIGREGTATLMARFGYDLTLVSQGLGLLGSRVLVEPLKVIACLGTALTVNWRLTLLSMIVAPPAALLFGRIGRELKRAARRQMESMSRVFAVIEETLIGLRIVQTYGGQRSMRRAFHRENKAYYREAMRIQLFDALSNPTTELVATSVVLMALLPGAYLVLRGQDSILGIKLSAGPMDIAELGLMYTLLAGVLDPARRMASVHSKLRKASAACQRIFALMDQQPTIRTAAAPRPFPEAVQTIEFREVAFSYDAPGEKSRREPALDQVSFTVNAGETVAIVGGNGSGKSTLTALLNRMIDPFHGAILFDGVDIREFALADLRQFVRGVPQQALLFDRSLVDNIKLGTVVDDADRLRDAMKSAAVDSFSEHLPDGAETLLGEGGRKLSGGQRQRVALARALVSSPPVLILDEATSAVDARTERQIHSQLSKLSEGRTTFIVTHLLSSELLEHVTKIVFLSRGRVLGVGTHEQLLSILPAYQALAESHRQKRAA